MALPAARHGRPVLAAARGFLSCYRAFVPAIFALVLVATLGPIFPSSSSDADAGDGGAGASVGVVRSNYLRRETFMALHSDPLRTRLDLIYRQAVDHAALVNAYGAYARRVKIDTSRLLHAFEGLVVSFSSTITRLSARDDAVDAIEEGPLRAIVKEFKDRVKVYRKLVAESKESFEAEIKIQKLRDTIFAINQQLHQARKLRELSSRIAAGSTPKSLHCLAMRLMQERVAHPESYDAAGSVPGRPEPSLDQYHYAIISDNVIAASVVVNSAVWNAAEPSKHVFHLVTDRMYLAAFHVWFARRPPSGGATVEIRSDADFPFLSAPSSQATAQRGGGLPPLDYLKFYLPEMYPQLRRIILLEDDVVVQRDMAALWRTDLDGKANGAVEVCFGPFRRYSHYLNFSHPMVGEKFSPRACAWGHGVNLFDLDAWRREKLTERFQYYENLNSDGTLWAPETGAAAAELMTFHGSTKPLDKAWNLMGLGRNPSITPAEITGAGAVHFDGTMKPWLDVAINQYKHIWTRYLDADEKFLQLCNFAL
ncbi:unnamed protein product [Spirodela intermedia]|uniref:Hexosyltransferase n=1 Tax=Spirodela intermedia TaxID=51605 RepID=A0A7I8KTI9_SPIIN|nr:unnamed protein product [Spirodela intermedia]